MAVPNDQTARTDERRTWLVYASVAGVLAALVLGSWLRLRESYVSCRDAARNLRRCRDAAEAILRLRDMPRAAGQILPNESVEDFASRVEKAAEAAGIPRQAIVRVDPQPLRRIGETPYQQRLVFLELHAVTVKQVVALLTTLQGGTKRFRVRNLRMTAPPSLGHARPERWHAELTLTNLVFAPINRRSRLTTSISPSPD